MCLCTCTVPAISYVEYSQIKNYYVLFYFFQTNSIFYTSSLVAFFFCIPNDICIQVTGMQLFSIKNRMSVINKE